MRYALDFNPSPKASDENWEPKRTNITGTGSEIRVTEAIRFSPNSKGYSRVRTDPPE